MVGVQLGRKIEQSRRERERIVGEDGQIEAGGQVESH